MADAPDHRCRVLLSPWPGLFATDTVSGRHYGRHSHGTYGFGVVAHGAHRSSSDRLSFDAYPGDIVATNPGEMHDGRPLGAATRHWSTIYVEPGLLSSMADLPDCGEVRITQAAFRDTELRSSVLALLQALEYWRQGSRDALACEQALVQSCGLLVARHTTHRPRTTSDFSVDAARRRLSEEWMAPPSLAQLAADAGVSRFQLLRRFTQGVGCTPHAWLTQQRVERARALIAAGSPLAEAASACGFADQAHMTRLFTRQFGFTPGAWRRAQAGLQ